MGYNFEDEDKMNNILDHASMNNEDELQNTMGYEITEIHHNHEDSDRHDNFASVASSIPNENNGSILPEEKVIVVKNTTSLSQTPQPALFYHDPNHRTLLITVGAVGAVLMIALSLLFFIALRSIVRKRRINKSKKNVCGYLTRFNIQDINLNKAHTGGWHGTYQNHLAQGKVQNKDDVETTDIESSDSSSTVNSSLVMSSLFMDSRIVDSTTITNNISKSTILFDFTIE